MNLGLPAGEYSNSVVVSVVANPMEVTSLTQLTYMQDMTSDICKVTPDYVDKDHYATKQLIDTRDGNKYWVAKLADGNCWMTQNLAISFKDFGDGEGMRAVTIDGKAGAILTSGNTDLNTISTYQTMIPTYTVATKVAYSDTTSNVYGYSWNLGKYVLARPLPEGGCLTDSSNPPDNRTGIMPGETLAACAKIGYVDVSDSSKWQPTFSAAAGEWDSTHHNLITAVPNDPNDLSKGGVYDAHYLNGNYYSFGAVTASSNSNNTSGDSPNSICPKGWRGTHATVSASEYGTLFQAYGMTRYNASIANSSNYNQKDIYTSWDLTTNPPSYNTYGPPLYQVPAGAVRPTYGDVAYIGNQAYIVNTSYGTTTSSALDTFIGAGTITAAQGAPRSNGYTFRCVAR